MYSIGKVYMEYYDRTANASNRLFISDFDKYLLESEKA